MNKDNIVENIHFVRGVNVMLDQDLAMLYGVQTRVLKQAVRRNIKRFPDDFMFELTRAVVQSLRSQVVTLKRGQHSKYLPFAFTEQGIAMLSSVLTSDRAISVNIEIMRALYISGAWLSICRNLKERSMSLKRSTTRNSQSCLKHPNY
ncbi:MAG: ORF6N domain-containing protein [Bacteroidales bacterium]|nr:ORF6N domain-containing protein [Bacteroidales bacterium]